MDFRVGDTVQAKSGGPEMTIEIIFGNEAATKLYTAYIDVKKGSALCLWLKDMELCKAIFDPESLILVERGDKYHFTS